MNRHQRLSLSAIRQIRTAILNETKTPVIVQRVPGGYRAYWAIPAETIQFIIKGSIYQEGPTDVDAAEKRVKVLTDTSIKYPQIYPDFKIRRTPTTIKYVAEFNERVKNGIPALEILFRNESKEDMAQFGVTGQGGQFKVFGALVEALRQILTTHPYQILLFAAAETSGHSRPDNRRSLYGRMLQRFLPNYVVYQQGAFFVAWDKGLAATHDNKPLTRNNLPFLHDRQGNIYVDATTVKLNGQMATGLAIDQDLNGLMSDEDAEPFVHQTIKVPVSAIRFVRDQIVLFDAQFANQQIERLSSQDLAKQMYGSHPTGVVNWEEVTKVFDQTIGQDIEGRHSGANRILDEYPEGVRERYPDLIEDDSKLESEYAELSDLIYGLDQAYIRSSLADEDSNDMVFQVELLYDLMKSFGIQPSRSTQAYVHGKITKEDNLYEIEEGIKEDAGKVADELRQIIQKLYEETSSDEQAEYSFDRMQKAIEDQDWEELVDSWQTLTSDMPYSVMPQSVREFRNFIQPMIGQNR